MYFVVYIDEEFFYRSHRIPPSFTAKSKKLNPSALFHLKIQKKNTSGQHVLQNIGDFTVKTTGFSPRFCIPSPSLPHSFTHEYSMRNKRKNVRIIINSITKNSIDIDVSCNIYMSCGLAKVEENNRIPKRKTCITLLIVE